MSARSTLALVLVSAAAMSVAGCGERAQTAGQGAAKKVDAKAWQGAPGTMFAADGFKAGDKAAWEAHLKARTERGQNEYTRTK